MKAQEILEVAKGKIVGCEDKEFTNVKSLKGSTKDSLTFVEKGKEHLLSQTEAEVIICSEGVDTTKFPNKCFIIVKNPKLSFVKVVNSFFATREKENYDNSGGCYVCESCVAVGKNIRVFPGCVIGNEGLGHIKDEDGSLINFPHLGRVVIEDNVEIKSNVVIDRGALDDTVIGAGSKINNLVHIGHNVKIGKNVIVGVNSVICGSTEVGDDTYIAPSVTIRDGIKIGKKCVIGMGSVVIKDIPDGEIWIGVPARKKE